MTDPRHDWHHEFSRFYGADCGIDGCQRENGHIGDHRRVEEITPRSLDRAAFRLVDDDGDGYGGREPTCCELACYEDEGCACEGCAPADTVPISRVTTPDGAVYTPEPAWITADQVADYLARNPDVADRTQRRIYVGLPQPTLRDRLAYLTDGCAPGPWSPVYTYSVGGGRVFDSLENEAGDSSFPDGDDIAAVVNALPALLDVVDAARAAMAAGWFTTNEDGDRTADALRAALAALDGMQEGQQRA